MVKSNDSHAAQTLTRVPPGNEALRSFHPGSGSLLARKGAGYRMHARIMGGVMSLRINLLAEGYESYSTKYLQRWLLALQGIFVLYAGVSY